jgi:hypothetical protein
MPEAEAGLGRLWTDLSSRLLYVCRKCGSDPLPGLRVVPSLDLFYSPRKKSDSENFPARIERKSKLSTHSTNKHLGLLSIRSFGRLEGSAILGVRGRLLALSLGAFQGDSCSNQVQSGILALLNTIHVCKFEFCKLLQFRQNTFSMLERLSSSYCIEITKLSESTGRR